LIRHHNDARRGIKGMRHFLKRDEAGPVAFVSRSVVRHTSVRVFSDWDPARAVVTDVARRVGISEVLRWSPVTAERGNKLVPITRVIDCQEGFEIDHVCVEGRPAQREAKRTVLEDHWTMARELDLQVQRLVSGIEGAVPNGDLFRPYFRGPPAFRSLV